MRNKPEEELMIRYVLGEVTEAEQNLIEECYITDKGFLEELLALEGALIDDYILGELSPEEETRVTRSLQTSSHLRRQAEFTTELIKAVSALRSKYSRFRNRDPLRLGFASFIFSEHKLARPVAVLTMVLAVTSLIWNLVLYRRAVILESQLSTQKHMEQELQQSLSYEAESSAQLLQAEKEKTRKLEVEVSRLSTGGERRASSEKSTLVTLLLRPTQLTRGPRTEESDVTLKAVATRIKLLIELPRGSSENTYNISISDDFGKKILSSSHLKPLNNRLVLIVPSRLFAKGSFILFVTGKNEAPMDYGFRILR